MTTDADAPASDRAGDQADVEPAAPPAAPPRRRAVLALHSVDRLRLAIGAVVVGQAVWLAVLMSGGWYYEADFSNLAAATGRSFTWSYLSESQGGHLDVIGRAVFLLLNRIDALNYPLTIVLRVLAQGYATYLLARLLLLLIGRRPGVFLVLALYAFSPMLVQSILFLTSSVNFLLSQIFLLWAVRAHVRYSLTRHLKYAAVAAVAMLAATLVSEQAAVTALMLPLLSFGYLHAGSVRRRLVETLRSWPEWLMIVVPIGVFVLFFLSSGKYHNGRLHTGAHGIVSSVWDEWTASVVPAMVGGPLRWWAGPGQYFSLADPARWMRIAAAALVALAMAVSVRRCGFRALIAWAIPFAVSGVGIAVVAVGRYTAFGTLIARQFEHVAYAAMPAAVAVALAFWAAAPEEIAARLAGTVTPAAVPARPTRVGRRRRGAGVSAAVATALVVGLSVTSGVTYTHRWWQAPAHRYVDSLQSNLRALGPNVSLFDTYVATSVMPAIAAYRKLSDLIGLMRLDGVQVQFDAGQSPRIVDDRGRVVPAQFFVEARVDISGTNQFCNDPISGTDEVLQVLTRQPRANEWFVRIEYFQQFPSIVYVQGIDAGQRVDPMGGSRVILVDRLGRTYLHLPRSRLSALAIRGSSSATRVCITRVELGYPFASSGS